MLTARHTIHTTYDRHTPFLDIDKGAGDYKYGIGVSQTLGSGKHTFCLVFFFFTFEIPPAVFRPAHSGRGTSFHEILLLHSTELRQLLVALEGDVEPLREDGNPYISRPT